MKEKEEYLIELRSQIERAVGMGMKTPKDFDILTSMIYARTHSMISSYTLKRFWGYLHSGDIRKSSLNTLCQFIGYIDWNAFTNSNADVNSSEFNFSKSLSSDMLIRGDRLRILWRPDRSIIIRYEGFNLFEVEESQNSKLHVGDRFQCHLFQENEPLLLSCLIRTGMPPSNYVCGKDGGITFQKINEF